MTLRVNWDWTLTHVMYCKIINFIWQMKLENSMIFLQHVLQTGVWRRSPASWSFWKYLMLLCSVITKCNDTQQADKLFADNRGTTLQSIGGCVLMLVSVYRVSNTQRPKNQIPAQHRIGVVRPTRWLVPTPDFQSTTGKNLNFPCFNNTVWTLRVKIKFWYVLLSIILRFYLTKISKCIKKNKPWTLSFDTRHEQ